MKRLITIIYSLLISVTVFAQIPKSGRYTYAIAYAEWGGKSFGATCSVIIKGDLIKVIHNGNKTITGTKGEIFDQGIIMKHKKSGKWIIGHNKNDIYTKEIGGCSDGPTEIDFKHKKLWSC